MKLLNPRWYEAMLASGYSGVREITGRLENLHGLQATTGRIEGWVFDETVRTFLVDTPMAERLQRLNAGAYRSMVDTLAEARDRGLWEPAEGIGEVLDEVQEGAMELAEFGTG